MRDKTYREHAINEFVDMEKALDVVHRSMDIFAQDITQHVWKEKYKYHDDGNHPHSSFARVCRGIYKNETEGVHEHLALSAMRAGLWIPAGRIHAGAGTQKHVTLINCFVDRTIEDSMIGIKEALGDAMLTMQQGGGIGMDFSTLRPKGALLKRTGSDASGPLPFMDMWNSMCSTIKSAGSRRGAMMAVMSCDHPDLPEFIQAKHTKDRLTNFNMSILVTDAFMDAVNADEQWYLGFKEAPMDNSHLFVVEQDGEPDWYVYSEWRARDLWDMIMKSTYEYSEPGVIFIDVINETNNLKYVETIACTNPCGEQPLPPNGACNLGAVNLARMVRYPFTREASFDYELLQRTAAIGVRFLDNVIDVTIYPLDAQMNEEEHKRRIGIGITGLANALAMMRITYGSEESLQTAQRITECLKNTVYAASIDLAKERGPFPMYDATMWGKDSPVVENLPTTIVEKLEAHGIRNGVLLTIAPTGTTSLYYGNVSSGLEPVFSWEAHRKILQDDNTFKKFYVVDYGYNVYQKVHGKTPLKELPAYMVDHHNLDVADHIRMQGVCQKNIDASISKTINCPEDISFDDFKLIYWDAYTTGCKGCTTYRPSDTRGSVLEAVKPEVATAKARARPTRLSGETYKIKWPQIDAAFYVTINQEGDPPRPYEIFISSTSARYAEWTTALTLMISAIMQTGHDVSFIPTELKKVVSATDTAWIGGKHYHSLVALIGDTIEQHFESLGIIEREPETNVTIIVEEPKKEKNTVYPRCPKCLGIMAPLEGCLICTDCGYSQCG
jgi:ribonucleoside-diphosphate reductase alpha chain